jgi:hypothetical protein
MLSGAWRPQLVVSVASPFGPVSGDEKLEVRGQKVLLLVAADGISHRSLASLRRWFTESGRGDGWKDLPSQPAVDELILRRD